MHTSVQNASVDNSAVIQICTSVVTIKSGDFACYSYPLPKSDVKVVCYQ